MLAYDADLSRLIVLPSLAIQAAHDPVVSPQALAAYRATIEAAGRGYLLAQAKTDEHEYSRLRDATCRGALRALAAWLDTGVRPDAPALQATCVAAAGDPADCRFLPPERRTAGQRQGAPG